MLCWRSRLQSRFHCQGWGSQNLRRFQSRLDQHDAELNLQGEVDAEHDAWLIDTDVDQTHLVSDLAVMNYRLLRIEQLLAHLDERLDRAEQAIAD